MKKTGRSAFEGWAIVDSRHSNSLAGYVSTQLVGNVPMVRVDVPGTAPGRVGLDLARPLPEQQPHFVLVSGRDVRQLTPVSKDVALLAAQEFAGHTIPAAVTVMAPAAREALVESRRANATASEQPDEESA